MRGCRNAAGTGAGRPLWARLEAVAGSNGEFTCAIPESLGAFDWYGGITFTLKTGGFAQPMSLSTKIYRCGEVPAK